MPANDLLATRLRELRARAGLTVAELAGRSGLAESAVYKAERGARKVFWSTLARAYDPLCLTAYERSDLLMTWALAQSDSPPGHYEARQSLDAALLQDAAARTQDSTAILQEIAQMTGDEQRALAAFARVFRQSALARKIAAALVEGD